MARTLVGILTSRSKQLSLQDEADKLGLDVLVFSPKDINWKNKRIKGYLFSRGKWTRVYSSVPLSIYNRRYTYHNKLSRKLEKLIGGKKVFNCVTWFDKWSIYSVLKKTNILSYLPDTMRYSPVNIKDMIGKYHKLIVKPCRGCLGRHVFRIENAQSHYCLYHNLNIPKIMEPTYERFAERMEELIRGKRFIVQQFIPFSTIEDQIFDVRIYVQKAHEGKWICPGGFCRLGAKGSYISNQCSELISINEMINDYNAFTMSQYKNMQTISLIVAKSIEEKVGHLGEVSVDYCIDSGGRLWIIEVNGHTQKKLLLEFDDSNLHSAYYYNPLAYAQHLAISKNAYGKS